MPLQQKYIPVFAGKTPEDKTIILYKHVDHEDDMHIQRPDGQLWALSPGAKMKMEFDIGSDKLRISIESPEWTGTAIGTRKDLLEAESR